MLRQNLKKPIYKLTDKERKEYEEGKWGEPDPRSNPVTFEHFGYKMEDDGEDDKERVPYIKSTDTGPIAKIKNIPGKFTKAKKSEPSEVAKIKNYPFEGIDKTETAPLKFMDVLRNKYSNRVKRIKRR